VFFFYYYYYVKNSTQYIKTGSWVNRKKVPNYGVSSTSKVSLFLGAAPHSVLFINDLAQLSHASDCFFYGNVRWLMLFKQYSERQKSSRRTRR